MTTAGQPSNPKPPADAMQAIVQDSYGSSEVLRLEEIDQPEIQNNEVLVKEDLSMVRRGDHFRQSRHQRPGEGTQFQISSVRYHPERTQDAVLHNTDF